MFASSQRLQARIDRPGGGVRRAAWIALAPLGRRPGALKRFLDERNA